MVDWLPFIKYGLFLKSKDRLFGFGESHNWCKHNIFWDLLYWDSLLIRYVLDAMHIEKNIFITSSCY